MVPVTISRTPSLFQRHSRAGIGTRHLRKRGVPSTPAAVSSLSSAPDPDSGRRTPVPGCADPLARAAAVGGDEYASHVAATGTFVRNQALVLGSRCDAQQLVHRVRAARARNAAIRSAGISHTMTHSAAMGNPARVA